MNFEGSRQDPNDSTGYSEIGLFYIRNHLYDKAIQYFKRGMELGPPGTGMNAYYYATCLEKLGNDEQAIKYLYHTIELDNNAISPWLDLLNLYSNKKNNFKTREIAQQIYQKQHLIEQLENDEILLIQNILN